jgi:hypothetical protein
MTGLLIEDAVEVQRPRADFRTDFAFGALFIFFEGIVRIPTFDVDAKGQSGGLFIPGQKYHNLLISFHHFSVFPG